MASKYTDKKRASNKKWDDAHVRRGTYQLPIDLYEQFEYYCISKGVSKNSVIKSLISELVQYDKYKKDFGNIYSDDD